ncbi:MAG: hypothetical protein IT452_11065 [Planctomycetia bacterium]|nr:hypothetical protein [Planctomycetia bacterium]
MTLDLSKDDLALLKGILEKEVGVIRVEIHHCRTNDYKDFLRKTEQQLNSLQDRVKAALG